MAMNPDSQPNEDGPPSAAGFLFRTAWAAGGDLCLAGAFLITWIWPYTFGEFAVHKFTFLMLLEFLVVHSTGFFAAISSRDETPLRRGLMFAGLLALYLLFAAGFSASYGGPWPLMAFAMLALPRAPSIILRPPDDDAQFMMMANWAAMTALYLFSIFFTLVYDIPPLGVTPEVIESQQFGIGGAWPEQPYRVMAHGAIYFTGQAVLAVLFEGLAFRRAQRKYLPKKLEGITGAK